MMKALELAKRPVFRSHRSVFHFTIFLLGSLLALECVALGQGNERKAWGYGFAAVGVAYESGYGGYGVVHFGGGGERLLAGGLGAAFELGYGSAFDGHGIGVLSPGVIYAFNREKKTVPFVNGGYTLFFRSGTAHGVFFGGGVNKWIGDRWGIRIEGRDYWEAGDRFNALEARVAFILR